MSEATNWSFSFTDLPKGYADFTLEEYVHIYRYEVREVDIPHYTESTESLSVDPNDSDHFICNISNAFTPETTTVSGQKIWEDHDDLMKRRPDSIEVILYRDNVEFQTKTVTAEDDWQFGFTDLYKYHDGGQEYVYSIGEIEISGYNVTVNGTTITNTMKTGKLTIYKTDTNDVPMAGIEFKVYSTDVENEGTVSIHCPPKRKHICWSRLRNTIVA